MGVDGGSLISGRPQVGPPDSPPRQDAAPVLLRRPGAPAWRGGSKPASFTPANSGSGTRRTRQGRDAPGQIVRETSFRPRRNAIPEGLPRVGRT